MSSSFRISTAHQWSTQPRTEVGLPQKWSEFSYDAERRMHPDDRGRKLFRDPFAPTRENPNPGSIDLTYGFERFMPSHLAPDRLDVLLEVARSRAEADAAASAQLATNRLITFRGIMTKLCTMLYDDRDGFELNAQLLGQTIYLEQYCSQEKYQTMVADMDNYTRRRNTYQGYCFESYCTTDLHPSPSPDARKRDVSPGRESSSSRESHGRQPPPPGWGGEVNTNEQWCVLMRSRLGDDRIIIGGEVDCVDHQNRLVELKTTMEMRSQRDRIFFEQKLVRFYFQSFLLGVPSLFIGYKTRQGIARGGEMFQTLELPRLVRGQPHAWDPQACLNLASSLLKHIHSVLAADRNAGRYASGGELARASRVFRVSRVPGSPSVDIGLLPDNAVQQMNTEASSRQPEENDSERVGILPKWYVDWVSSQKQEARQHVP